MNVTVGVYKKARAVILQNDLLRAVVLPERGSKIASLVYRPLGRELLWQTAGEEYPPAKYADPYGPEHATGFDEMFPTISPCWCEDFPWAGTAMPDHGEVWSLRGTMRSRTTTWPWEFTA